MTEPLSIYFEPLSEEESDFLRRRLKQDRSGFRKTVYVLLIIGLLMSYGFGWARVEETEFKVDEFSVLRFLIGLGILWGIIGAASYWSFRLTTRNLLKDIKSNVKCVEQTFIRQKKYMPQNNSYHFFLDSPNKYSIEVSEEDYQNLEVNDEVNIEFTPYAKIYLQYF